MGHYWREVFPREAAAAEQAAASKFNRERRIKNEIRNIPLDKFYAEDLPALLRLMDPIHFGRAFPADLDWFEVRINSLRVHEKQISVPATPEKTDGRG